MSKLLENPWYFDKLGLGKEKGLNNESDIFKDKDNLGLETAQNCRNSCAKDEKEDDLEVCVEYRLKNIATSNFPGRDNYIKRPEKAIEFFQTKQNSKNTCRIEKFEALRYWPKEPYTAVQLSYF